MITCCSRWAGCAVHARRVFTEYLLLGYGKNYRTYSRLSFFKKVNEFWLIEGFPQGPQWSYFIYKQLEEETPLLFVEGFRQIFLKPSLWAPSCLPPNSGTLKKHTYFGKTSLFVQHATNNQKRQKVWIMQNCFLGLILVFLCRDSLFEHINKGAILI